MFDNRLKSVSIDKIEKAISQAVRELVDYEYECNVSSLEFEGVGRARMQLTLSIPVKVRKEVEGS